MSRVEVEKLSYLYPHLPSPIHKLYLTERGVSCIKLRLCHFGIGVENQSTAVYNFYLYKRHMVWLGIELGLQGHRPASKSMSHYIKLH